jgi:hypothetical protein
MTQPNYNFTPVSINWDAYDVPALWSMLEPEQGWSNRSQVSAWLRMHDMLVAHQENLQRIREGIVERWSPEGSVAAQLFGKRLDDLIDSAQEASYAARSNASALNLLTDALLDARSGIERLYRAWQSAAPQQQAQLNRQAQAIMNQADARVIEHGNQFTRPPDVPQASLESWKPDSGQSQESPTVPGRPVVPPLEASPAGDPDWVPASNGTQTSSPAGPDSGSAWGQASPKPVLSGTPRVLPTGSIPPAWVDADRALMHSGPPAGSLPVPGVLALPPVVGDHQADSFAAWRGTQGGGTGGIATEVPDPAGAPVRPGGRGLTGGRAAAESAPLTGGLVGGGLGTRPLDNRRPQYPAEEEWELPVGVAPIIRPAPERDPRTAFDPGPNVIGGRR